MQAALKLEYKRSLNYAIFSCTFTDTEQLLSRLTFALPCPSTMDTPVVRRLILLSVDMQDEVR